MQKLLTYYNSLLVIILPLLYNGMGGFFNQIQTAAIVIASASLMGFYIYTMAILSQDESKSLCITRTDVIILIYFVYALANWVFVRGSFLDPALILKWSSFIMIYLLFRISTNKRILILSLILSGVLQSIISITQKLGIIKSNHLFFDITGSFGNPGQLGGYLSVILVVAIGFIKLYNCKFDSRDAILYIGTFLMGFTLLFTDSRAGLFALASGLLFLYWRNIWKIKKFVPFLFLAALIAAIFLYSYKKDSADGRLLIWKVSGKMITEKPFTGHGIGTFIEKYMLYQAEFIKNNPNLKQNFLADNIAYPYNEFIHLWIEQGLPGLIIFLLLLYFLLKDRKLTVPNHILGAGIISFIVFSCFSYPVSIYPLLFLFVFCAANMQCRTILEIPFSKTLKMIAPPLLIGLVIIIACIYNCNRILNNAVKNIDKDKKYVSIIEKHYNKLVNIPVLNISYHEWLSKNTNDPSYISTLINVIPSCENYCMLGDYFKKSGFSDNALNFYWKAHYMVPSRLQPTYKLWKTYRAKGDIVSAERVAKLIKEQTLRVENTFTLKTRSEVNEWLINYKSDTLQDK